MPNICFGQKLLSETIYFNDCLKNNHDQIMYLLELCLTPGIHTVEYETCAHAYESLKHIVSIVAPFMQIGSCGLDLLSSAVSDITNGLVATDLDIIFINVHLKNQFKAQDFLVSHGTTIIIDIKNK